MRQSIFSRIINSVFWALLIVQAGCDVPPSSPAKQRDSPETEEDSLIPPLFTKRTMPGVSIAELQKAQDQFVKGNGFAQDSDCAPATIASRFQIASVSKTIGAKATRRWQLILANRVTGGSMEAPIIGAVFRGTVVDFSDLCNQLK